MVGGQSRVWLGGQRGNLGTRGGWPEREPRVWWVAREGT